jgi:aldose 1-epimerase
MVICQPFGAGRPMMPNRRSREISILVLGKIALALESVLGCRMTSPGNHSSLIHNQILKRQGFHMTRLTKMYTLTMLAAGVGLMAQEVEDFDDIKLYTLKNANGLIVKITNYGATITSILAPDRNGKMVDIALGYDRVEDYMNAVDKPYFGAIVGRYGNRIAGGQFQLMGETFQLAKNNGENHLHGGTIGFDKVVWKAVFKPSENRLVLSYLAKDREEGYPGNLDVQVTYSLTDDNELVVEYFATTDQATPVNLTQHTYFNLRGEGEGTIVFHELMINADKFTPVDKTMIPTGEIVDVQDTPFDFRQSKTIGREISSIDKQLQFGGGYDHNWVLNRTDSEEMTLAAKAYEPASGRVLEVFTTEPGIQFYSGNFLDGRLKGKSGKPYRKQSGFCLETQHFPDSPNQPGFPDTILLPGNDYRSKTIFKFSTR